MNLFELFVKIGVDDQATDHISKMGETLKSGLATAAKVGTAAVTAASGAVLGLAKKATDAYGSFEQLKGGVETLFGSAADEVMKNADKAFATAGVSANNYMETVTSFAASLIQATGRGAQTDLDELESTLDQHLTDTKETLADEYEATKQTLADQLAERKKYWDSIINGEVSGDSKKALQSQKDAEIAAIKETNAAALAERKKYWEDYIAAQTSGDQKKALQEQKKLEVDALKDANSAKLEERKKYWKEVIAAEEDKERKKQLQESRDAELDALKSANAAQLEELKKNWDNVIANTAQGTSELKKTLQAQRDADLAELKKANEEKLASVKQTWTDTISADTQSGKDQKKALQAQRDADLEALKKANAAKLAEMKKQNKKTLKQLEQANKDQLELTESLNNQSTTTEESLQKAAELADMALKDMSDNANKMGTNMASIQNAYQGFAKQNYTMLDNLKLGYGGTKEEMNRLLDTASKLAGVEFKLGSYADIVQAIHVIQQEMGITGTTAEEASATITGSLSAVKAAWENVLVGISSGEQIEERITAFGETALAFAGNYFPRIQESIQGIFKLIEVAVPKIAEKIPEFINEGLPKILEAGVKLVTSLGGAMVGALPELLSSIGSLLSRAFSAIKAFFTAPEQINSLKKSGEDVINGLISGISGALGWLLSTASDIVKAIADGIPRAVGWLVESARSLITNLGNFLGNEENVSRLLASASDIVGKIADGIIKAVEQLGQAAVELITGLVDFLLDEERMNELGEAAGEIVGKIVAGIIDFVWRLGEAGAKIITGLSDNLTGDGEGEHGEDLEKIGNNILDAIVTAMYSAWDEIVPTLDKITENLKNYFDSIDWEKTGEDIINDFIDSLARNAAKDRKRLEDLKNAIADWFTNLNWDNIGSTMLDFLLNTLTFGLYGSTKQMINAWNGNEQGQALGAGLGKGISNANDRYLETYEKELARLGVETRTHVEESGTDAALDRFQEIAGTTGTTVNQTINIYAPEASPSEIARELSYAEERRAIHH